MYVAVGGDRGILVNSEGPRGQVGSETTAMEMELRVRGWKVAGEIEWRAGAAGASAIVYFEWD